MGSNTQKSPGVRNISSSPAPKNLSDKVGNPIKGGLQGRSTHHTSSKSSGEGSKGQGSKTFRARNPRGYSDRQADGGAGVSVGMNASANRVSEISGPPSIPTSPKKMGPKGTRGAASGD